MEKSFSLAQDSRSLGHKTHHSIIIQEHRQTLCSHDEASIHKVESLTQKNHLPKKATVLLQQSLHLKLT